MPAAVALLRIEDVIRKPKSGGCGLPLFFYGLMMVELSEMDEKQTQIYLQSILDVRAEVILRRRKKKGY